MKNLRNAFDVGEAGVSKRSFGEDKQEKKLKGKVLKEGQIRE